MNRIGFILVAASVTMLAFSTDAHARGGRGGGGGGGGARAGGGGASYSRSAPSRSPSVSRAPAQSSHRPSVSQPSVSRPSAGAAAGSRTSVGARPSTGTRPSTGARPTTGARPSQGQLNSFLDMSGPSSGGAAAAVAGGGAAAAFLNSPQTGQRPGTADGRTEGISNRTETRTDNLDSRTDNRTGNIDDRTDRVDTRTDDTAREDRGERVDDRGDERIDNVDNRTDNRGGRVEDRGENRIARVDSRPERFTDREERFDQRQNRRDEVRDQFHDHHPRYDFWKDNPNWARWRFNRPYRWATWGLISGWFPGVWAQPSSYSYGDNIYYEGDTVYYGDQAVVTSEEYAEQAQTIATSAVEPPADAEWLPLGVFAMTQDGEASGPPPTLFLQLTVSKEGVIGGTVTNTETDESQPIEGMIDKETQRCAWAVAGQDSPIMETGLSNLTKDEAPALLHFSDGQTQQWLLVRMEDPEGEAGAN